MGTLEAYTHGAKSHKEKLGKDELMKLGDEAFDAEDFDKALDYYHRVTVLDGQDAAAWTALAMTFHNMDFPREAWRSYKLALQTDPDGAETLWFASEFLYNMEDYVLAKVLLERYLEREVDADRLTEARDMLVEVERELAASDASTARAKPQFDPDEEDEDDEEDLPDGYEFDEEEDELDDDDDDDFDDDFDDEDFDEDNETFVASLVLQLSGYDAQCANCSTRIPMDAPYCYMCLAPHFYED